MIFLVWLADGVKEIIDMIVAIVSFNYVLYIVTKKDEGSYKILWLILILAFPLPGTFLYWCYGNQKSAKPIRKKLDSSEGEIKVYSEVCNDELINKISEENPHLATVLARTQKETDFPVVRNENARYFALMKQRKNVWSCICIPICRQWMRFQVQAIWSTGLMNGGCLR